MNFADFGHFAWFYKVVSDTFRLFSATLMVLDDFKLVSFDSIFHDFMHISCFRFDARLLNKYQSSKLPKPTNK